MNLDIEWLTKSINKEIAIKTFIAVADSGIAGIATLGGRSKYADIGLVAVDEKSRRIGIATDLIFYAINAAFKLGYDMIKVVTQLQNKGAIKLYERCDFHIESTINVYHYWQ